MNKVKFVLASRQQDGKLAVVSQQGVNDEEARLILDTAQQTQLKSITPFISVRDTSKGLLLRGRDAGDLITIINRSLLGSKSRKEISLYLLHRISQGLLFLRSQTSDQVIDGFIQVCRLDPYTGRFEKKAFLNFFGKQSDTVNTVLWANLSAFLAKMDQEYLDAQPLVDVLLRSIARISTDYEPRFDSTMTFDIGLDKIPSDILLIGAVVGDDQSIISVLLDKQDSYSKSIIQEGYMSDTKAQASLINFINDDPFLKAAFATSPSALDGNGIQEQKIDIDEAVIQDAMISIERRKESDVYGQDASWFDWWRARSAKE